MRRLPPSVVMVACLSLLAVQLSGLHMHVNDHGYTGTPQGTHVHGEGTHSHGDEADIHDAAIHGHEHGGDQDHDGDKDVSIVKLGAGGSKLLILHAWLGLSRLIPLTLGEKLSPYSAAPRFIGRHERWRPPLRAPPHLS